MLIRDKKHFAMGTILGITFWVVLAIMFTPIFGKQNAFEASDDMFNSIAKGSTFYIPEVTETVKQAPAQTFEYEILSGKTALQEGAVKIFTSNGAQAEIQGQAVKVSGDLNTLLLGALSDSEEMFYNKDDVLKQKYGLSGRQALYTWYSSLNDISKAFKFDKKARPADLVDMVNAKAVEVGYNFFGVEPESAKSKAGILTFALVFYVVYTMWWGFSIFYLFEGIGLVMTAGKKKEV